MAIQYDPDKVIVCGCQFLAQNQKYGDHASHGQVYKSLFLAYTETSIPLTSPREFYNEVKIHFKNHQNHFTLCDLL